MPENNKVKRKLREISDDELKKVLEEHKKWLESYRDKTLKGARANLSWTNLRRRSLSWADLQMANLFEADLLEADLQGANLRNANLRGADLLDADLTEADFSEADLSGVDLTSANTHEWVIKGVKCTHIRRNEKRVPPDHDFAPGEFEEVYAWRGPTHSSAGPEAAGVQP